MTSVSTIVLGKNGWPERRKGHLSPGIEVVDPIAAHSEGWKWPILQIAVDQKQMKSLLQEDTGLAKLVLAVLIQILEAEVSRYEILRTDGYASRISK